MRILALTNGDNGCDYHRIFNPFKYLTLEDGEEISFVDTFRQNGIPVQEFKDADIVVFNRQPGIPNAQFLYFKERYKFKVWNDVDDYWVLYKEHHLYGQHIKLETAAKIQNAMRFSDIVTCTNDRLAEKAKKFNNHVEVISNAVPLGYDQFSPKRTESELTRFMYVGGPSHYRDLNSIRDVFRLCRENDRISHKSSFILSGMSPNSVPLIQMEKIMSITRNFNTRPELLVYKYMDHYNHADIALAPLEDNEFNTYKSNLKIIEAGSMGIPIIVSKMYPFLQDKQAASKGVLFCDSNNMWLEAIKMFIDEPQKISELGQKLYDYVENEYNLIKVNEKRRQIINFLKSEIQNK